MKKQIALSPDHVAHLLGVWLVVFVLLFIPKPYALSPFLEPKTYMLLVLPVLLLFSARRVPLDWVTGTIVGMLVVATLSLLMSGEEVEVVVYGTPGRYEGLLYVVAIHASLLMLYSTFKTNMPNLKKTIPYLAFAAVAESVIVVLQVHNLDFISRIALPGQDVPLGIGTFGNYGIASYFLALCTVVFYFLGFNDRRMWWVAGITTLALILLGNRSALLLVFLPLVLQFIQSKNRSVLLTLIAALPVLTFGNQVYANTLKPHLMVKADHREGRTFTDPKTLSTRKQMLNMALQTLLKGKNSPWLGGGDTRYQLMQRQVDPELVFQLDQTEAPFKYKNKRTVTIGTFKTYTYTLYYCDYIKPCHWEDVVQMPINNRVHNTYLDYYFQYGIFYTLGFLALLVTALLKAWRHPKQLTVVGGLLLANMLYLGIWFLSIGNAVLLFSVVVFVLAWKQSPETHELQSV